MADGPFDLFSDMDSRIRHLERIGRALTCVGVMNLAMGVLNSVNPTHVGWINLLRSTFLTYYLRR